MAFSSSSRAPDRTPRNPRGLADRTDAGASDRAANRLPDLSQLMDSSPEVEFLGAGPPTQSNPNQQRRTPSTTVPIPQQGSSPASESDHFYSARQTPAQSQSPAPDLSTERQIDFDSYGFHVNDLVHPSRPTERDLERLPRYDPRNLSADQSPVSPTIRRMTNSPAPSNSSQHRRVSLTPMPMTQQGLSPASGSDRFHSAKETPVSSPRPSPGPNPERTYDPSEERQIDPTSYAFQVNSLVHPVRRTERDLENLPKYDPANPSAESTEFEERFDPTIRSRLIGPEQIIGMSWAEVIRMVDDWSIENNRPDQIIDRGRRRREKHRNGVNGIRREV